MVSVLLLKHLMNVISWGKLPPKNNRMNWYDNQELNLHSHNWCEGSGEAEAEWWAPAIGKKSKSLDKYKWKQTGRGGKI